MLVAMWGLGFGNSRHREVSLLGSLCECKVGCFNLNFTRWVPFFSSPVLAEALGLTRGSLTGRHFDKPPKIGLLAWRDTEIMLMSATS